MAISLGDALQVFLNKSRFKNGLQAAQIKDIWEKIMGVAVNKYTDHIVLYNQVLIIKTSDGTLRNNLLFEKENIKKRIEEEIPGIVIKEIRIS